jgi:hypothetical protein
MALALATSPIAGSAGRKGSLQRVGQGGPQPPCVPDARPSPRPVRPARAMGWRRRPREATTCSESPAEVRLPGAGLGHSGPDSSGPAPPSPPRTVAPVDAAARSRRLGAMASGKPGQTTAQAADCRRPWTDGASAPEVWRAPPASNGTWASAHRQTSRQRCRNRPHRATKRALRCPVPTRPAATSVAHQARGTRRLPTDSLRRDRAGRRCGSALTRHRSPATPGWKAAATPEGPVRDPRVAVR